MHKHLLKSNICKSYNTNMVTLRCMLVKIGITHLNKFLTPIEYKKFKESYGSPDEPK